MLAPCLQITKKSHYATLGNDFMNEIVIQYVQFMKSLKNATSFLNVLQSCYTSLQSSAAHKSLYRLKETVPPFSKLF